MLKAILNLKEAQVLSKKEQAELNGGNGIMCHPITTTRPCTCANLPGCGFPVGHVCTDGSFALCP